ncbi:hypothetical protein D7X55_15455 [Corallococcus sp. AB049A]|uniref:Uncharacterized protein n=1 Tax=Corallococcus interemptor TaxID=2316720 RepID=A0A3A8QE70_9BACT|nr:MULTISPECIES: hypothetical protein [Corallococcus]RKH48913.1 hypothetical protein D7Y23_18720 [Corallococcus sp. AB050B]RKH65290.1 hypothetical protein D7X96_23920 [Corallococcus interemptor]RKI66045.1 hypothetical protein D7X55_15455 [Corallococcus sp. AB049A]
MDGEPSDSGLVVMGNQRVRALYAGANHLVAGALDVELLVPSGSDGSLVVGGALPSNKVLNNFWALCREVGSGRSKVRPPP